MKHIGANNVADSEVKVPLVKVNEDNLTKDNFV